MASKPDRPLSFARARVLARWGLLLGLFGCGGSDDPAPAAQRAGRPDVLLVTIDTLRADHLGCYGYGRDTSPNLDRLAREGLRFPLAYAPVSATSPSHATLFTSQHPLAHGLVRNGLSLEERHRTMAEVFRQSGYRTAAFVSSYPVSRRFGFQQGFEHFDDRFESEGGTFAAQEWEGNEVSGAFDRRGGDTVDAALGFLDRVPADATLFAWVHLFDPHAPYEAPPGFAGSFRADADDPSTAVAAAYDAEILYADHQLGRLLEGWAAARPGDPLTIVTSDHGEGLGARGWLYHNRSTFEEELRVPLILHWKERLPADRRVRAPAHLIDVLPTLVSLLRLDRTGALIQGADHSAHFVGRTGSDTDRPLYLLRPYYPQGRPDVDPDEQGLGLGLRLGPWKYFEAPEEGRRELYDLSSDPQERVNLADRQEAPLAQLAQIVARWRDRQLQLGADIERALPADVRAGLEALGYAGEEEPEEQ